MSELNCGDSDGDRGEVKCGTEVLKKGGKNKINTQGNHTFCCAMKVSYKFEPLSTTILNRFFALFYFITLSILTNTHQNLQRMKPFVFSSNTIDMIH